MRDIVTASYNPASTLKTKTSSNGTSNRPEYRSYRDFLESYNEKNSKDDQESISSTDSGVSSCKLSESKSNNTSTSSLNSEINGTNSKSAPKIVGANRTSSFKDYLENYNNKKFTSVKPTIAAKQNLIKSEIVIRVNEGAKNSLKQLKNGTRTPSEQDETDCSCTSPLSSNEFLPSPPVCENEVSNFPPPPPLVAPNCPPPPPLVAPNCPPPPPPPKFPEFTSNTNGVAKKWETIEIENSIKSPNDPAKLPTNAAAVNLAKVLTQHLQARRKRCEETECKSENVQKNNHSFVPNGIARTTSQPEETKPTFVTQKSVTLERNTLKPAKSANFSPSQVCTSKVAAKVSQFDTARSSEDPPPSLPQTLPPKASKTLRCGPSPPPPSLPNSLPPQFSKVSQPSFSRLPSPPQLPNSPPPTVSQTTKFPVSKMSTLPLTKTKSCAAKSSNDNCVDYSTTTVVPVTDGSQKVNKNDPNVRKLVYNTYRGLLGAYNNKANDMIATLPRNMVREDQGITKQLENIALQGGLEKLNGRTNPKVEQE